MSLLNLVKNMNTGLRQPFGLNCTNTWVSSSEKWAEEQCGSPRTGLSPGSQEIVSDQSSSIIMAAPSFHPLCICRLVGPFCAPDPAKELRIQSRTGQTRPLLSESLELVPRGLLQNVSRGKGAHPCSGDRQNGAGLRWEPAFLQDATVREHGSRTLRKAAVCISTVPQGPGRQLTPPKTQCVGCGDWDGQRGGTATVAEELLGEWKENKQRGEVGSRCLPSQWALRTLD